MNGIYRMKPYGSPFPNPVHLVHPVKNVVVKLQGQIRELRMLSPSYVWIFRVFGLFRG